MKERLYAFYQNNDFYAYTISKETAKQFHQLRPLLRKKVFKVTDLEIEDMYYKTGMRCIIEMPVSDTIKKKTGLDFLGYINIELEDAMRDINKVFEEFPTEAIFTPTRFIRDDDVKEAVSEIYDIYEANAEYGLCGFETLLLNYLHEKQTLNTTKKRS